MYPHTMEYYSVIYKNRILPFTATLMDLESMMLSEKANPKKLHCMIPFCNIFVEYLFIVAVMGLSGSMQDL